MAILETDANTVGHWRLNSLEEVLDLSGGANHVTSLGDDGAMASSPWGNTLSLPGGRSLDDNDAVTFVPAQAQAVSDALHNALLSKTWTIDVIYRTSSVRPSGHYSLLLGYGDDANDLWPLTIQAWKEGADPAERPFLPGNSARSYGAISAGTSAIQAEERQIVLNQFAVATFRCYITSGSTYRYDLVLNTKFAGASATSTAAVPTPAKADCKLYFGWGDRIGTSWNGDQWNGEIVEVRIRTNTPTIEEIYDYHWDAITQGSADSTAPTISNVSPADGSTIGPHDAWQGTVTDDVSFRQMMVWVKFTDEKGHERGREVIWDGIEGEFAAAYSASTRTEVTAGLVYRFEIYRTGGWPYSPEVFVSAIDAAGNEGTDAVL